MNAAQPTAQTQTGFFSYCSARMDVGILVGSAFVEKNVRFGGNGSVRPLVELEAGATIVDAISLAH